MHSEVSILILHKFKRFIFFVVFLIACFGCNKDTSSVALWDFKACSILSGSNQSLEVVSFNIESFPKSISTVDLVANMLNAIDADIYALQEIYFESEFNKLVDLMPGYVGLFNLVNDDEFLNLSYIIKTLEIELFPEDSRLLFVDSVFQFPRSPFEIKVRHKPSNLNLYIINNHFRASDSESRRQASLMLKEYIDDYQFNDPVIILGDFNDKMIQDSSPFYNFISDNLNYSLVDKDIAESKTEICSFPSNSSHIDHFIVTNELFSLVDTMVVFMVDRCYIDYYNDISDHRPIGVKFSTKSLK